MNFYYPSPVATALGILMVPAWAIQYPGATIVWVFEYHLYLVTFHNHPAPHGAISGLHAVWYLWDSNTNGQHLYIMRSDIEVLVQHRPQSPMFGPGGPILLVMFIRNNGVCLLF